VPPALHGDSVEPDIDLSLRKESTQTLHSSQGNLQPPNQGVAPLIRRWHAEQESLPVAEVKVRSRKRAAASGGPEVAHRQRDSPMGSPNDRTLSFKPTSAFSHHGSSRVPPNPGVANASSVTTAATRASASASSGASVASSVRLVRVKMHPDGPPRGQVRLHSLRRFHTRRRHELARLVAPTGSRAKSDC
jgi:hypothetical protein